jgi:hypothetical protein
MGAYITFYMSASKTENATIYTPELTCELDENCMGEERPTYTSINEAVVGEIEYMESIGETVISVDLMLSSSMTSSGLPCKVSNLLKWSRQFNRLEPTHEWATYSSDFMKNRRAEALEAKILELQKAGNTRFTALVKLIEGNGYPLETIRLARRDWGHLSHTHCDDSKMFDLPGRYAEQLREAATYLYDSVKC